MKTTHIFQVDRKATGSKRSEMKATHVFQVLPTGQPTLMMWDDDLKGFRSVVDPYKGFFLLDDEGQQDKLAWMVDAADKLGREMTLIPFGHPKGVPSRIVGTVKKTLA